MWVDFLLPTTTRLHITPPTTALHRFYIIHIKIRVSLLLQLSQRLLSRHAQLSVRGGANYLQDTS